MAQGLGRPKGKRYKYFLLLQIIFIIFRRLFIPVEIFIIRKIFLIKNL